MVTYPTAKNVAVARPIERTTGKHKVIDEQYKQGWRDEQEVVRVLRSLGHNVEQANEDDDRYRDIDIWVDGVPVSIKTNGAKYYAANFLFELYRYCEPKGKEGAWFRSWYYTGEAKAYIVWKKHPNGGGTMFWIDKNDLVAYVDEHGFDREAGLTKAVKDVQQLHSQKDTKNGLIAKSKLICNNIAKAFYDDVPRSKCTVEVR